jgi:hypothetical protein
MVRQQTKQDDAGKMSQFQMIVSRLSLRCCLPGKDNRNAQSKDDLTLF